MPLFLIPNFFIYLLHKTIQKLTKWLQYSSFLYFSLSIRFKRKPMTDSSNHLKHHSQMSKKISKKQAFRNNLISNGINTHEEEKMEISNRDEKMVQQEENKKNRNNDGLIESDSESEEQKEINLEEIKKSKNILEKNQDKIAEISHYLILKNVKT